MTDPKFFFIKSRIKRREDLTFWIKKNQIENNEIIIYKIAGSNQEILFSYSDIDSKKRIRFFLLLAGGIILILSNLIVRFRINFD